MPKQPVYNVDYETLDDETLDGEKKGFFGKTPNWLRNIACVFSGLTLGFVNVEPKVNFENKFANKFAEFFLKALRNLLSITVGVLLFGVLPLAVPPLAPLVVIGLGVGLASVFLNGSRAEKRNGREGELRPKNKITEKAPEQTEEKERSSDKNPKKTEEKERSSDKNPKKAPASEKSEHEARLSSDVTRYNTEKTPTQHRKNPPNQHHRTENLSDKLS
jgi:hypothetical protein